MRQGPGGRVGQAELLEQLVGPGPGRLLARWDSRPTMYEVLPAGQVLVDRGVLAGQADGAGAPNRPGGPRRGPRWRPASRSGAMMVDRMRTTVVLPGPVGPEQAQYGAGLDRQREPVQGPHLALR